jgi:DNA-binding transcriptional LysR family regulator
MSSRRMPRLESCAPEDWTWASDLRTLAKENFIIPPRELAPGLYDLILSHCRAFGFTPRITQHARQMQTVIGLVSSGMGIALVPSSLRNLKRTGVHYRQLRGKAPLIDLGVLRVRGSESPSRERFVEHYGPPPPSPVRSPVQPGSRSPER